MTRTAAQLLSPPEVADRLRVPVNTIYKWRTRGQGPPGFKAGRRLHYRASDIEDWVDEQITRGRRR